METGRSKIVLPQIRLPHGFRKGLSYWHHYFRVCIGHSLLSTVHLGRMTHPVSILAPCSFYGFNVWFNVSRIFGVETRRALAYSELFVVCINDVGCQSY